MYVPYYDPAAVYGTWPYAAYPPYYFGYPSYIGAGVIAAGLAFLLYRQHLSFEARLPVFFGAVLHVVHASVVRLFSHLLTRTFSLSSDAASR